MRRVRQSGHACHLLVRPMLHHWSRLGHQEGTRPLSGTQACQAAAPEAEFSNPGLPPGRHPQK